MALSVGQDDDALEQPSQFMLYHYDASGAVYRGRFPNLQPAGPLPTHYLISDVRVGDVFYTS
jgi:hypothetical protein